MKNVIFTCPKTDAKVLHRIQAADDTSDLEHYDAIGCPACGGVHFVHMKTGKLFGRKDRK